MIARRVLLAVALALAGATACSKALGQTVPPQPPADVAPSPQGRAHVYDMHLVGQYTRDAYLPITIKLTADRPLTDIRLAMQAGDAGVISQLTPTNTRQVSNGRWVTTVVVRSVPLLHSNYMIVTPGFPPPMDESGLGVFFVMDPAFQPVIRVRSEGDRIYARATMTVAAPYGRHAHVRTTVLFQRYQDGSWRTLRRARQTNLTGFRNQTVEGSDTPTLQLHVRGLQHQLDRGRRYRVVSRYQIGNGFGGGLGHLIVQGGTTKRVPAGRPQ